MKTILRLTLLAAFLTAAPVAFAQTAWTGLIGDNCDAPAMIEAQGIELYAIKVAGDGASSTDLLYDLSVKTSGMSDLSNRIGFAEVSGGFNYAAPGGNFNGTELATDTFFFVLTTNDGRMAIDSGLSSLATGEQALGAIGLQRIGGTLDTGRLAGTSLTWDGTATPQMIDMGMQTIAYPAGAAGGIEVVFGALVDTNDTADGIAQCTWGGKVQHPTSGQGGILGYNIYRRVDDGSMTAPDLSADPLTIVDWLDFMPLRDHVRTIPHDGGMGMDSPADLNASGDYVGFQNNNGGGGAGTDSDGDEYLIYADTLVGGRSQPGNQSAALTDGTGYWYFLQPVLVGDHADWVGVDTLLSGGIPPVGVTVAAAQVTAHTIDLDADSSPEFISPQATAGFPGLGLTNGGAILTGAAVYGAANPAAAVGHLGLRIAPSVGLVLTTSLEAANVLGYNVYRVSVFGQARVNEALIAADGSGSTYRVSEKRGTSVVRLRRSSRYVVEVVFNDGTPSRTEGPFDVSVAGRDARRRR